MSFRAHLSRICRSNLGDEFLEGEFDNFAFAVREVVDPASLDQTTQTKERFPARYGIGSDHGMRDFEIQSDARGKSAHTIEELVVVFLLDPGKLRLVVSRFQAFRTFLPRRRERIISFAA